MDMRDGFGRRGRGVGAARSRRPHGRNAIGFHGTIGGGTLEWQAIAKAQACSASRRSSNLSFHALGPELGQCCGGRVQLVTEVFAFSDLAEAGFCRAGRDRRLRRRGRILAPEISSKVRRQQPPALSFRRGPCRPRARAGAGAAAFRYHLDRSAARCVSRVVPVQCSDCPTCNPVAEIATRHRALCAGDDP